MKKLLLFAVLLLTSLGAAANFNGSGYYRTQNATTERYAYLLDNTGWYDTHATTADVLALGLYSKFLRASSDPSTIFYYTKISETTNGTMTINIAGQGTSIHDFLDAYLNMLKLKEANGKNIYLIYGTKGGLTKYLGDIQDSKLKDEGYASIDAQKEYRYWWIDPVSAANDDNYLGIAPTLTVGNKYYYPFYAAFDFNAYSSGMKFYIISKVENGVAVLKELSGVVPASTPVIVECSNLLASGNRLNVGPSGSKADVSGNKLGGVYFDNPMVTHFNRTKYDKNTMRILTVKNGKLVFETSSTLEYLPRNQAYLNVSAGTAADVKVMTEAEYAKYLEQLEYEKNLISAISISPASTSIEKGSSVALTATTTPAKPSNPNLTWSSSNTSVATVDANGKVTAAAAGSATITVSADNGVKATASVTVTVAPSSISLDKTSVSLEKGASATLVATVGPSDCTDKSVTWSSDNTTVATVDANGNVTAAGAGSATITAKTSNGMTALATVTVSVSAASVTLDKTDLSIERGESVTLVATVGPSDCTDKSVTWSSDNTSVATVDSNGNVTAVGPGSADITVRTSNGVTASAKVTVIVSATGIELNETEIDVLEGESYQLVATVTPDDCTDKTVTWSTSSPYAATVDSTGLVTILKDGLVVITAKTANGLTASCIFNALSGVDKVLASPDAEIYDVQGNRVNEMMRGQVYIIRLNGTSIKVAK